MQTSDYILLGIGVLISCVGYVFKRTLEGMQADIKQLQEHQVASQVNQMGISTKLEATLQSVNRLLDKED